MGVGRTRTTVNIEIKMDFSECPLFCVRKSHLIFM